MTLSGVQGQRGGGGPTVSTIYGKGRLCYYRKEDRMYAIDMPFGKLFCTKHALQKKKKETPPNDDATTTSTTTTTTTDKELNIAYEQLEKVRKLNLEVACEAAGVTCTNADQCTACLLKGPPPKLAQRHERQDARLKTRFPRLHSLVEYGRERKQAQSSPPCLLCGNPTCSGHASAEFRREGILVCQECEKFFGMDFVVDCLTATTTSSGGSKHEESSSSLQMITRMVDLYDRVLLVLQYSAQFIPDVAEALEETTARQNKVGLGSSSAGFVSGVLGIAAAATILTPAGPPLLIASLLAGGSASAVQTGCEVKNYLSEPRRLADRILALHGLLLNILRVASTLRTALVRDCMQSGEQYDNDNDDDDRSLVSGAAKKGMAVAEKLQEHRTTLLAGATVGRYGVAGMEMSQLFQVAEVGTVAGRNARFFSRTGSGLMRSMRFARFAGGALAAATLVFEANCLADTIGNIQKGNPCEKAVLIRRVLDDLPSLPSASRVDEECREYLALYKKRRRAMTEREVTKLLMEFVQEQREQQQQQREQEQAQQEQGGTMEVQGDEVQRGSATGGGGGGEADDQDGILVVPPAAAGAANALSPAAQSPAAPSLAACHPTTTATRAVVSRSNSNSSGGASSLNSRSSLFERIEWVKAQAQEQIKVATENASAAVSSERIERVKAQAQEQIKTATENASAAVSSASESASAAVSSALASEYNTGATTTTNDNKKTAASSTATMEGSQHSTASSSSSTTLLDRIEWHKKQQQQQQR